MVKPVQALANQDSIRTLSLVVGALLVATPAVAAAQASPAQASPAQAPTAADRAQSLFKEGATLYKMSDYIGALDKFTAAFKYSAQIEDDRLRERVLHALQFNLARAHVKTYKLDQELMHLRQAVDLLENYTEDGADLGIELEADSLIAEAEAELARRDEPTASGATTAMPNEAASQSSPIEGGGRAKPGKILTLTGYGSLGMSALGLGLMVGGLVMGSNADKNDTEADTAVQLQDAERRGKLGNTFTIAGAATAGVFAVAGVVLVVLGKRASPRAGRAARIWVSPSAGAALTGLQVGGRF